MVSTCQYHFSRSHNYGTCNKKGQLSANANCAEIGTNSYTVAMFSKEFKEWNSLTTHKGESAWRTDIRSAALAVAMFLVWASCFQLFVFTLSLLKFNSESPNNLPNPHFYITAMCGATQLTIVAQRPTAWATLALGPKLFFFSALLLRVQNKVVATVILACMLFKSGLNGTLTLYVDRDVESTHYAQSWCVV